jgi:hypothetical protein
MQFYQQLQQATALDRDFLLSSPIIADAIAGKIDLATYIAFLNQAYHHVRHTVPLLMLAGSQLRPQQQWLQPALANYIGEEMGHEKWILNDLAACAVDRDTFEQAAAPFDSEIMVAYLYDTVQRTNPVGIFGMVQVLEGTSASLAPSVADIVQNKLGLPDRAISYLRSHGTLDQDHLKDFENIMNQVERQDDQNAIIKVTRNVYRLYGNVYRAIPEEAARLSNSQPGLAA